MTARRLGIALLVAALGGCALPSWVPLVGKAKESPAPRVASPPSERGAERSPTPPARPTPGDDVTDRVVAVVNNDAITLGELQESIIAFRQENRGQVKLNDEELMREFLTRLIDTRLQLQEAEREKVTTEEIEVTEELEGRMKRFGANNLQELETMVKAQGLTMDAIRKRVRDTLRVAKVVRRKVTLRVSVTEDEVDRYLAENRDKLETGLKYHARHILIVSPGGSDAAWEAARIRAEMLRKQITEGADFAELARQHSKDASAKDGGDLGTLRRGELSQEIEAQILSLQPGQLSAPYRSSLGYHLFRLEEKESLEGDALQRVHPQVRDILFRQKYEVRLAAWLKEIKERAVIEIRL
ncbi:MAG: peptidylprolyl isomerase [Candidatus Rokubacteria bacterium]|nr:peptidylprolyl isomerase [Candidatus Rokubacteria bacterium]